MSRIMRIHKWRFWFGVIIICIIVFDVFSFFIFGFGLSGSLASRWNMVTIEDTESVDSSFPSNGIKFSIVSDVLIFANSLIVSSRLFFDDDSIFLLGSMAKASLTSVESLLLDDLGHAGVTIEALGGSKGASKHK